MGDPTAPRKADDAGSTAETDAQSERSEHRSGKRAVAARLQAARVEARERYRLIAEAMKREVGIRHHYHHKQISGIAWTDRGRILAPEGVTRRQLYVLAHECAHIILHATPDGQRKPSHIKEHEAETYAHRAFKRYDVEVPEQSSRWARAYVGQWIMKDRAEGIPICREAAAFAAGQRSPHDPLPGLDDARTRDFSKSIQRFIARGEREVARQDAAQTATRNATAVGFPEVLAPERGENVPRPPNACGTCLYYEKEFYNYDNARCTAHVMFAINARTRHDQCHHGESWRASHKALTDLRRTVAIDTPPAPGFVHRLGVAFIERMRRK